MQKDMPDPVANVIHKMLGAADITLSSVFLIELLSDHIHSMETRQKEMCSVINKLGNYLSPADLDTLNVNLCSTSSRV